MSVTTISSASRWADAQVVVAAYAGTGCGTAALEPAARALRRSLPDAQIVLLWPAAVELPAAASLLADRVVLYPVPRAGISRPARVARSVARVVAALRAEAPAAAIVLTEAGHAPFLPAYLCYLAGVPRRFGISAEFGGGLLTQAVPAPETLTERDHHLHLLDAIGLRVPRGVAEEARAEAAPERPATAGATR